MYNQQLQYINLSYNVIEFINEDSFLHFKALQVLDLSYNDIIFFSCYAFAITQTRNDLYLNIEFNPILEVTVNSFLYIDILVSDDGKLCCAIQVRDCRSRFLVNSCEALLHSEAVHITVWILGLIVIILNVGTCIYNNTVVADLKETQTKSNVLLLLINSLFCSDILCGIYLLILAISHSTYGALYSVYSYNWERSALCSVLSFISMLYFLMSSVSMIMIAVVRLYTIKKGLTASPEFVKLVKIVRAILWLVYISIVTVLTMNEDKNIIQNRICVMFFSQTMVQER